MKIKRLELVAFMSHDHTEIELPETGVVVIEGTNGSGKSSLIEAVTFSHWGKTLRGTPPWRPDSAGDLTVESDRAEVYRKVSEKGTKRLRWNAPGEPAQKYDTASKAETELRETVGSMDVWRRTHVFSSADAVMFSTATDGERKRLVESILGIDRFDEALKDCRANRAALEYAQSSAAAEINSLDIRRQALEQQLTTLREPVLTQLEPPEPIDATADHEALEKLQTSYESATSIRDRRERTKIPDIDSEHAEMLTEAMTVSRQAMAAVNLARAGKCSTCEQDYTLVSVDDAEAAFKAAKAIEQDARTKLHAVLNAHQCAGDDMRKQLQDSHKLVSELYVEIAQTRARIAIADARVKDIEKHGEACAKLAEQHQVAHSKWADLRRQLTSELVDIDDALDLAAEAQQTREKSLDEHAMAEQVLGLKGVRVPVLSQALRAVETLANTWLAQIHPDLSVHVRPYTQLKSGDTSQTISLDVSGVGAGHGYRASSGGERRRIDAALLLAFADVAGAAAGRAGGTLWIDEVFDALDEAGCEAVGEMLMEIGQHRCVVVITHRSELAEALYRDYAVTRYEVRDGFMGLHGAKRRH